MLEPDPYATWVLFALQKRNIYAGSVPDAVVARRRARNRQQRRSRKINRRSR
ncbi:MAG: hypothetical protein ACRDRL_12340 [Sciscionella sp.]